MTTPANDGGSGEESVVQPCPKCNKSLRLVQKLHGKRVRCKGCGTVLLASADPWGLSIAEDAAAPPQPAAAQPAAPKPAAAAPAGSALPPLRSDPPAAEGFPAVDTGDAGPAVAAAQPRRSKLPAKALIIAGACVVVVLVVGLVAAVMLTGGGKDPLAYVPDDSNVIVSVNVEKIVASPIVQKMLEAEDSPLKKAQEEIESVFKLSDIKRVVVAGNTSGSDEPLIVCEFTRAMDPEDVVKKAGVKFQEINHADMTIYQNLSSSAMSLCFVDDRTVLVGKAMKIREVLDRTGEPKLPEKLQTCIEQLDFSQAIVGAVAMPDQLPDLPPMIPISPETLDKVEAATFQIDVTSDLTVAATLICQDSKTAEQIKKMVDGLVALAGMSEDVPPELQELLDALEVTHSEQNVSARITISEKLIDKAMKGDIQMGMSQDMPPEMPPGMSPDMPPDMPPEMPPEM